MKAEDDGEKKENWYVMGRSLSTQSDATNENLSCNSEPTVPPVVLVTAKRPGNGAPLVPTEMADDADPHDNEKISDAR